MESYIKYLFILYGQQLWYPLGSFNMQNDNVNAETEEELDGETKVLKNTINYYYTILYNI